MIRNQNVREEDAGEGAGNDAQQEHHPPVPLYGEPKAIQFSTGLEIPWEEALDKLDKQQEVLCWSNTRCHGRIRQTLTFALGPRGRFLLTFH